jgi:RimJ/RimL family protein N-acetyltransferase
MPPILHGLNIVLRPPCEADIEARLALGRDAHIAEMFGASREDLRPMTRDEASQWVQRLQGQSYAWVLETDGAFIGEIRLDRVDARDRRASMAIGIYDPAYLSRGLGTQAIKRLTEHAFDVMRLHRIAIRVLAYNQRAIRAYEKCGFVVEGRERESAFVNGAWHDDVMMGLLEKDFQRATAPVPVSVSA